jgi:hypothetical protein
MKKMFVFKSVHELGQMSFTDFGKDISYSQESCQLIIININKFKASSF